VLPHVDDTCRPAHALYIQYAAEWATNAVDREGIVRATYGIEYILQRRSHCGGRCHNSVPD